MGGERAWAVGEEQKTNGEGNCFLLLKKAVAKILWCYSPHCLSRGRDNLSQKEINKIKCKLFLNTSPFSQVWTRGQLSIFLSLSGNLCLFVFSWESRNRNLLLLATSPWGNGRVPSLLWDIIQLFHLWIFPPSSLPSPPVLLSLPSPSLPLPPSVKIKWSSIQILSKQRSFFLGLIKRKEAICSLPLLLRVSSRKHKRFNLLIFSARSRTFWLL